MQSFVEFASNMQLQVAATFYPRDAMLARVFATATCPSVCPSVRPSVTRRYCAYIAERKQDREMYTV